MYFKIRCSPTTATWFSQHQRRWDDNNNKLLSNSNSRALSTWCKQLIFVQRKPKGVNTQMKAFDEFTQSVHWREFAFLTIFILFWTENMRVKFVQTYQDIVITSFCGLQICLKLTYLDCESSKRRNMLVVSFRAILSSVCLSVCNSEKSQSLIRPAGLCPTVSLSLCQFSAIIILWISKSNSPDYTRESHRD